MCSSPHNSDRDGLFTSTWVPSLCISVRKQILQYNDVIKGKTFFLYFLSIAVVPVVVVIMSVYDLFNLEKKGNKNEIKYGGVQIEKTNEYKGMIFGI